MRPLTSKVIIANRQSHHSRPLTARWRFWVIVALVVGAALIFMFGGDGLWHSLVLRRRVAELETSVDSLSRTDELMKQQIDGLKHGDPQVLEEEARSHGMIKSGEKVYVVRPKPKKE